MPACLPPLRLVAYTPHRHAGRPCRRDVPHNSIRGAQTGPRLSETRFVPHAAPERTQAGRDSLRVPDRHNALNRYACAHGGARGGPVECGSHAGCGHIDVPYGWALTSDDKQVVTAEGDTIRIMPAQPQVIYVPMYDGPVLAAEIAARPPPEDAAPVTGAIAPGSDTPAPSSRAPSAAAPPEAVPAGAGAAPTVAAGGSTVGYPPALGRPKAQN